RRTARLNDDLQLIGFALGGEAGAHLAVRLGMTVSPDTLLQRIRQAALPEHTTPSVLGVDDWAKRKGQSYGTILVDLEKRRPVDLLPDRESETLATWLKTHSGVEIISRDRGGAYADGARKGAPEAIQVADRFHLLRNVSEAVERFLARKHKSVREAARAVACCAAAPSVATEEALITGAVKQKPAELARERKLARYEEVREMYRQGVTIRRIAQHFRMHRRTVRLFIRAEVVPERAIPQQRGSRLDRFAGYLKQRWEEGCHNAAELWRELRGQGYRGSQSRVRKYIAQWRAHLPASLKRARRGEPQPQTDSFRTPSARAATWMLMGTTDELETDQRSFIKQLFNICPEAQTVRTLAANFNQMIRMRQAKALDGWLAEAEESKVPELKGFAAGIRRDKDAVTAALTHEWSQGQVEGQVNRLKVIKRQMYGRANFDLLRARVLHAA
ncbi:MAG: ISL3 family transposase, partial [Pyrinomonadaceae bacterium]|nr:ISL3 family transposase [Pyrinomonadaceae bacterium]